VLKSDPSMHKSITREQTHSHTGVGFAITQHGRAATKKINTEKTEQTERVMHEKLPLAL